VLLELGTPLTKVGGHFVAYKGSEAAAELKASAQAIKELNLNLEQVFEIDLPFAMGSRTLLVFRKLRPTPPSYPRKAGIPNKQPL
jgi:16S rRNA (guanine527-N7)-methyltransferase